MSGGPGPSPPAGPPADPVGPGPRAAAGALRGRLRLLAPVAAGAGLILLLVLLMLSGCPEPAEPPSPGPRARLGTVPTVRVLVASGPGLRLAATGGYRVLADGRDVVHSAGPLAETPVVRDGRVWRLGEDVLRAESLALEPAAGSLVAVGGTRYRGRLVLAPVGRRGVWAVNHVDVESYLAGVLAKELLPDWLPTTYRAQAIAARTYALHEKAMFGASHAYDLRDDQSSQVYGGSSAETPTSRAAVADTRGIVLATGPAGRERIFRAHYSACCGGRTNNAGILYDPVVDSGPLVGGAVCTDCSACRLFRWEAVAVPKTAVHRSLGRAFPAVRDLRGVAAIEVASSIADRPLWVRVIGGRGRSVRIRAEDVRLALLRSGDGKGLYSMNCPIRADDRHIVFGPGRGFGHGVGLCQWGAQGMAARGCSVREILGRYYPGARLFKAYP